MKSNPKEQTRTRLIPSLLLLHRFARVLLITTAAITLLSLYNINVNALIAALGIGGLAVSLAAQDTLSNVISGIMIMMDQPFRVGDRIEIPKLIPGAMSLISACAPPASARQITAW